MWTTADRGAGDRAETRRPQTQNITSETQNILQFEDNLKTGGLKSKFLVGRL